MEQLVEECFKLIEEGIIYLFTGIEKGIIYLFTGIITFFIYIFTNIYEAFKADKYISSFILYILVYLTCILNIYFNQIKVTDEEINNINMGIFITCILGAIINIIHIFIWYFYKEAKILIYFTLLCVILVQVTAIILASMLIDKIKENEEYQKTRIHLSIIFVHLIAPIVLSLLILFDSGNSFIDSIKSLFNYQSGHSMQTNNIIQIDNQNKNNIDPKKNFDSSAKDKAVNNKKIETENITSISKLNKVN